MSDCPDILFAPLWTRPLAPAKGRPTRAALREFLRDKRSLTRKAPFVRCSAYGAFPIRHLVITKQFEFVVHVEYISWGSPFSERLLAPCWPANIVPELGLAWLRALCCDTEAEGGWISRACLRVVMLLLGTIVNFRQNLISWRHRPWN